MKKLICCFVLSAVALLADVTGKWSGTFTHDEDGQSKTETAYASLKQSGNDITGTAGPSAEQQFPIKKGSIAGDKITLEVQADEGVFQVLLTLDGDRMLGEVHGQDGQGNKLMAKLDLKREK
jgi:hypothetical protein